MNVKELIERLSTYDKEAPVVFYGSDDVVYNNNIVNVTSVACNPTTIYNAVLNPPDHLVDREDPKDYFKDGDPARFLRET